MNLAIAGAKTYIGTPCRRAGHTLRFSATGHCVECKRAHHAANREKEREYNREYHLANQEKIRERMAERYHANADRENALTRKWREANSEKVRETSRQWRAANLGKRTAYQRAREAAQIQRTPPWADLVAIQKVYEQAAGWTDTFGEPFHVDHVIPLRGKLVSGLHVHENLRILPAVENMKKHNRFDPDDVRAA